MIAVTAEAHNPTRSQCDRPARMMAGERKSLGDHLKGKDLNVKNSWKPLFAGFFVLGWALVRSDLQPALPQAMHQKIECRHQQQGD